MFEWWYLTEDNCKSAGSVTCVKKSVAWRARLLTTPSQKHWQPSWNVTMFYGATNFALHTCCTSTLGIELGILKSDSLMRTLYALMCRMLIIPWHCMWLLHAVIFKRNFDIFATWQKSVRVSFDRACTEGWPILQASLRTDDTDNFNSIVSQTAATLAL